MKHKHLPREEETEKTILGLAQRLSSVDPVETKKIFKIYAQNKDNFSGIGKLRNEIKRKHPILFERCINKSGQIISFDEQEKVKDKVLADHGRKIKSFKSLSHIEKYLNEAHKTSDLLKKEVSKIFPSDKYLLSFRIKEPESIKQNIDWGNSYTLVDIVGLRIVPKRASMLPVTIEKFEKIFGDRLSFKFNIFSYTPEEIVRRISKNSIYYRAHHYHFHLDEYFCEVQIRTKGVDLWANLNHDTMYKKKIKVTKKEEKEIMKFGKIANKVDYFEMLQK